MPAASLVAAALLVLDTGQVSRRDAAAPLPTLTVTAQAASATPALPGTTQVIDAERLRRAGVGVHVGEALRRVAGVVANDRSNEAQDLQLSVRGYGARASFGVRGVRLWVNGIPASAPDGQGQLAHAPLSAGARVEVVRGPLAALYGNGGGVVKVDADADPRSQAVTGAIAATGELRRIAAGARGGDAQAGWRIDLARIDTDGFRPQSAARRAVLDALGVASLPSGWRASATVNALDAPRAEDPLGLDPASFARDPDATAAPALAFDTRKATRQLQAGASLLRDPAEPVGASVAVYAGRREIEQFLAIPVAAQSAPTSGGGVVALERRYAGLAVRTWRDFAPWSLPLRVSVGFDVDRLDEGRRGFENFVGSRLGVRGRLRRDEDNQIDRLDLLLHADWQPHPDWRVLAGVRRNRIAFESDDRYIVPGNPDDSGSRRFAASVPMLGVRFAPGAWRAHAAWARSFETPTANELGYRADGSAGFNLTLQPTRSSMRELGFGRDDGPTQLAVTAFHDLSQDEIVVARAQGGRSAFRNGGPVRRRGLELELAHRFDAAWTLALTWTWIEARFERDLPACAIAPCAPGAQAIVRGARLPAVPPRLGFAELHWRPGPDWSAQLELRAADGMFADDANRQRAKAWVAANLAAERRIHLPWGEGRVALRIDNLADRRYVGSVIVNDANGRGFEPAPGRRAWVSIDWAW